MQITSVIIPAISALLGTVIGGVITYYINKQNHQHEITKSTNELKRQKIEQLLLDFRIHYQNVQKLSVLYQQQLKHNSPFKDFYALYAKNPELDMVALGSKNIDLFTLVEIYTPEILQQYAELYGKNCINLMDAIALNEEVYSSAKVETIAQLHKRNIESFKMFYNALMKYLQSVINNEKINISPPE